LLLRSGNRTRQRGQIVVRSMTLCRTRQPTIFFAASRRVHRVARVTAGLDLRFRIAPLQLGNTFSGALVDQRLSARQVCVLQLDVEIRDGLVVRYFDLCNFRSVRQACLQGARAWVPVLPAQARARNGHARCRYPAHQVLLRHCILQRLRTPRLTQPAGGRSQTNALGRFTDSVVARQLRDRSTRRLALIQGIMARSFSPTCSIWCSAVKRRRACRVGAPARFSRMKLFAYSPV